MTNYTPEIPICGVEHTPGSRVDDCYFCLLKQRDELALSREELLAAMKEIQRLSLSPCHDSPMQIYRMASAALTGEANTSDLCACHDPVNIRHGLKCLKHMDAGSQ